MYDKIKILASSPRFTDDEKNRIAGILNLMVIATMAGLFLLWLYRVTVGEFANVLPIGIESLLVMISLVLLRRKMLGWSSALFLWTLLGFLDYLGASATRGGKVGRPVHGPLRRRSN